jgi:hypothetical protein
MLILNSVPVGCVARCEWTGGESVWRKAAPTRLPKPTSAVPAERFKRTVGVEYFDADAGSRVDVKERLTSCALFWAGGEGLRCHHAALSADLASAKPRR